MAVMISKDRKEMMVDCSCGCDQGMRFRVEKEEFSENLSTYCFVSYTSGNWSRDQGETWWKILKKKLKKIVSIIRNKDYYYSEIMLDEHDFREFKEYINSIE